MDDTQPMQQGDPATTFARLPGDTPLDEAMRGPMLQPEGDDMAAKRDPLVVTGTPETEPPEPTAADLVADQCVALIGALDAREINAVMVRLRGEFGG